MVDEECLQTTDRIGYEEMVGWGGGMGRDEVWVEPAKFRSEAAKLVPIR